jgi:hypothetical protein
MSNWTKKGLIYCPDGESGWDQDSFMTPTPLLLDKNTIRIYGGCRDKAGVSRIRYIDVASDNPSRILKISEKPSLDIGVNGCFDDNGVILGDVIRVEDRFLMYYVGFQLVNKVKFLAFSGLAISEDGGENFMRVSDVPICDRSNDSKYFRAIHTVIMENGKYKTWLGAGGRWKYISGIPYPSYGIWYAESFDGKNFPANDLVKCISPSSSEYRIGRPRVYKRDNGYEMYYTRDFIKKDYVIGYAISNDGVNWTRRDELFNMEKSKIGWDSEMCCYPALLDNGKDIFMFYSGNGMGKTGVGYAQKKQG